MVTPVELFRNSNESWPAQILVRDNDGTCWVRLPNIHNEDAFTHKNFRVIKAIELHSETFSVQTDPTANAEKEKFNFEKHDRIAGQHL